jgi:hypothetical protein
MRGAAMLAALLHLALAFVPCAAAGGVSLHRAAVEQHAGADFQHDDALCALCSAHQSASAPSGRIVAWLGAADRVSARPVAAAAIALGPTLRPSSRAPPGAA